MIAPSTRRTRFDVSTERGLTTFVGKQRELELLLDGFVQAKSGRGQVFSIVSEAGGGKSRLLYEFRKAVSNEDVTFLEGKCLSYSKGVAYCSVIDILKSNFDIREENGYSEITEKVKNGLTALEADEAQTLPYILELLSVKDSGNISVPSSIQEVIMARVDSLPEETKEFLQTGSVVEREFSFELIKKVTGLSDETLVSILSILKDAELLFERGILPQATFIFKHALTREVLYDSILTRKRKTLHRKIGDAIENLYKTHSPCVSMFVLH